MTSKNDPPTAPSLDAIDRLWYLYLLDCADGTTYTGITTDSIRR